MAFTLVANVDYSKVEDKKICSTSLNLFLAQAKNLLENYKDEEQSKFLNQCLRGINRILPHLQDKNEANSFIHEHADTFFKLSHQAVPWVKIQILLVLFQILKNDLYSENTNRYYRVVYELVQNPAILSSN